MPFPATDQPEPRTPTGRRSAPEAARAAGLNPVDYLRARGFVQDISDEDGLRDAFAAGPVTFYMGFDPTGPSLHAGHMAGIMFMATLQRMGHRPIAVAGGGTAMIGDPTGRTTVRESIPLDQLDTNMRGITSQLARYLDFQGGAFGDNAAAVMVNNADWLLDLRYIDFLREIGRHFSVNEMLATEAYRKPFESVGLNFAEFNYRLVQSYDFLHLFRTEHCTLQLGGSDQWANILGGVDLIRRVDQHHVFAMVQPIITTSTGEKMGKTGTGVRVWLDADQFSPYDYFQYWINTDDSQVETYLKRFTLIHDDDIAELVRQPGEALRDAKRVLAWEATAMAHGPEAAEQAAATARTLFASSGTVSASDDTLPTTTIPRADLTDAFTLADAFIAAELASSRGEARRLAQQGGLSVDDVRQATVDIPLTTVIGAADAVLLRAGKKRFRRLTISE